MGGQRVASTTPAMTRGSDGEECAWEARTTPATPSGVAIMTKERKMSLRKRRTASTTLMMTKAGDDDSEGIGQRA